MRIRGKTAIVTGSGSGLGRATAHRMAAEGAIVFINDVNQANAQTVVEEITRSGGNAIVAQGDVTKPAEIKDLFKSVTDRFGRLDILVNNAGVSRNKPYLQMSDAEWDIVLGVNLKGVFNCSQAAAPHMMAQKYGKIVNIASVAGTGCAEFASGGAGMNYAASKAGVIQMTKSLARELGPYGVNVNCVAPGHTPTPLAFTGENEEEQKQHSAQRASVTCLRRNGKPEDIANAILFLSSEEASFISGQTLCVDGGRTDRL